MTKGLQDILYRAGALETEGPIDRRITSLELDSRKVGRDSLFAAMTGTKTDGHRFIGQAIEQGAACVLCEKMPGSRPEGVTFIRVKDVPEALGHIADNFFDHPSSALKLVGVTGTNGKTTTASLLYQVFTALGYPCGLLSTISNRIIDRELPATHTTPDVIAINRLLKEMVDSRCEYAFMEVSSHAIDQKRIAGLNFRGGIFTNITHDHLDYHKTFDAYLKAKKAFFDGLPASSFALSNLDDRNGRVMLQNCRADKKFYALQKGADYKGLVLENDFSGMLLRINGTELWSPLVGRFNAYNLLAVYGSARELGAEPEGLLPVLSKIMPAEGRFEYVRDKNGRTAIVDYAHSPDALKNVLETINDVREGSGRLITVVGAGGDRDTSKRPLMAALACKHSNKVVLTSDNPRSEDPMMIIKDMLKGLDAPARSKTISITDRREAIRTACALADKGDIVLVAGKGHEKYQEIKGVRHHFDDKEEVAKALKETEQ